MTTILDPTSSRTSLWRYAVCGLFLPGSFIAMFMVLIVLGAIFGGDIQTPTWLILLVGCVVLGAGGGLWGRSLLRRTGTLPTRRLILASAISYAVMTLLSIVVLGKLEEYFVGDGHSPLPLHNLFTLLFVSATFISAAVVAGVMGRAIGNWRLAFRLAWRSGGTAALTFLAFNVLQDLLGRRVGGPNAAETATMITVTLICNIATVLTMSAVMGRLLEGESHAHNH